MGEEELVKGHAAILTYDDLNKKWVPRTYDRLKMQILCDRDTGQSRLVAWQHGDDNEAELNIVIGRGVRYNPATPTFHQLRDRSQTVYGFNFGSKADAEGFSRAINKALETASERTPKHSSPAPTSTANSSSASSTPRVEVVPPSSPALTEESNASKNSTACIQLTKADGEEDSGKTENETPTATSTSNGDSTNIHCSSNNVYSDHSTPTASDSGSSSSMEGDSKSRDFREKLMRSVLQSTVAASSDPLRNMTAPTSTAATSAPPPPPVPPPPPPPPPPPTAAPPITALTAAAGGNSLANQLAAVQLKRTGGDSQQHHAPPVEQQRGRSPAGAGDVVSEMERLFASRRQNKNSTERAISPGPPAHYRPPAKRDSTSSSARSTPQPNNNDSKTAAVPNSTSGETVTLPTHLLEEMKKEIMAEVKREIRRSQGEIIDAIRMELAKLK